MPKTGPVVSPCPITPVVEVILGQWVTEVLWSLHDGPVRFTELRRRLPTITAKVLTQRLRQLERDGLVTRTAYAEAPPRVEYEATSLGQSLGPVFDTLLAWSDAHLWEVEAARRAHRRAAQSE